MFDSTKIIEKIEEFKTREEVKIYLEELKLKKSDLLSIGKKLSRLVSAKDSKEKIIDRIINATVGAKLRVEAIKMIDLSKNY